MFTTEVIAHSQNLKPFALKLTRNMADSEDLLQETFMKAFSNEDKFQKGTNLKAWLFTIMKNIFINDYRKKSKVNGIVEIEDNMHLVKSSLSIQNLADVSIAKDNIMMSIRSLSLEYRVPFMLYYKGYKYNEISEKMNLPLGTVKSRIFFARRELKELLVDYNENK